MAANESEFSTSMLHPDPIDGYTPSMIRGDGQEAKTTWREFFIDTGEAYTFIWAARFVYVRNKNSRIFDTSFSDWIDNITSAPEVDDGDEFLTNFIYHPIIGSMYYMYYREKEHSVFKAAIGSAVLSTLWEYAVEGFVETPSLSDLVFTPALGIPLGIGMEATSEWLINTDNILGIIAGHAMNPIKLLVKDGKNGFLNPLTGTYAFQKPFTLDEKKRHEMEFIDPFVTESPFPVGRIDLNMDIVNLDDRDLGGQIILYSVRADFSSKSGKYGGYVKLPYGGVNNAVDNGEKISDGFELGNILIGSKMSFLNRANYAVSGGFEFTIPSARKDNRERLQTAIRYKKDLPLYLEKATTLSSYVSAAAKVGWVSLVSSLGTDLITNATKFEQNKVEVRFKFGVAGGVKADVWSQPTFLAEFNGYSMPTVRTTKKNDMFITTGVRFGTNFSPGFGIQIPVSGSSADVAKADFIMNFKAWF